MDSNLVDQDEVSSVILSPGEPLLLRCRFRRGRRKAAWEKDSRQLTPDEFPCSAKIKAVRRYLQIHGNKKAASCDDVLSFPDVRPI